MIRRGTLAGALLLSLALSAGLHGQGTYLSSGGPVNQGMGGASTAAPVDSIGALYWNPATISALPSELAFGVGLLLPLAETSSSISGLASGSSESESGVAVLPTVGWVHQLEDTPVTLGLGIFSVAGYKTNYAASTTNPLFMPQSNAPGGLGGFGRVFTGAEFFQVAPSVSVALSEQLSVGFGPTLTLGQIFMDPLFATAPDDADGSGAARYPSGRGTRVHWGGGAQIGLYYIKDDAWHFGFSLKSPQWMEDFRFNTEDENGLPRVGRARVDLPAIASLGVAYSGFERVVMALDLRYFDYKNTDGWGPHGYRPDGSLNGLGMSSVLAVATGVQMALSESRFVRFGYTYNQSPFQSAEVTGATLAALYYQHQVHIGFSHKLSDVVAFNFGYSFYPRATLSGPITTPAGNVPGSNITTRVEVHHATFGVSVRY